MENRQLTPLDKVLSGVDTALRTVFANTPHTARPNPAADVADATMNDTQRMHSAGLMRVNHAGEVAAQGLYQGHAAVARDAAIEKQMTDAANEELDHLGWCEQRLQELGSGPSRLSPVWYSGAFVIGAASGILGDKWSLGFIEETERQVADHLTHHLNRLPPADEKSRAIVKQMRDEEQQHGANARDAGAAPLPAAVRRMMQASAKLMTGSAYWF
jgi:ubiquinone biosynthesis monooxygenase Coq7